ncbi:TPA: hypothetical protein QCW24_006623, partial [Bacillus thuringiensis]|nr:hypothetical protein [Bacillus thuringiensis]
MGAIVAFLLGYVFNNGFILILGSFLLIILVFLSISKLLGPILNGITLLFYRLIGPELLITNKNFIAQKRKNSTVILLLSSLIIVTITATSLLNVLKAGMKEVAYRNFVTDIVISSDLYMNSTLLPEINTTFEEIKGVKTAIPVTVVAGGEIKKEQSKAS